MTSILDHQPTTQNMCFSIKPGVMSGLQLCIQQTRDMVIDHLAAPRGFDNLKVQHRSDAIRLALLASWQKKNTPTAPYFPLEPHSQGFDPHSQGFGPQTCSSLRVHELLGKFFPIEPGVKETFFVHLIHLPWRFLSNRTPQVDHGCSICYFGSKDKQASSLAS